MSLYYSEQRRREDEQMEARRIEFERRIKDSAARGFETFRYWEAVDPKDLPVEIPGRVARQFGALLL
jgi:hypothetical protein